ncbi:hypothetical protein [Flavobacterium sp.]|jgi:hypothetical protein|uniref:hypothetical protein n=1 Tax=Flavobacterium sp. TaxID=239 RepID=UPI0025BBBA63|nr:hypothetical protein [Flavobacterium sp.]
MKNIEFKNTHPDHKLSLFQKLANKIADASGYKSELKTDESLSQILRLRVAQRIVYCLLEKQK